jgi:hypothetical protein
MRHGSSPPIYAAPYILQYAVESTMDEQQHDRMAIPRKRGRPSLAEISARAAPVEAVAIVITTINLPAMSGFRCPHCGRGQAPRITKTAGLIRFCLCGLCGKSMRVEYSTDGMARTIYPI